MIFDKLTKSILFEYILIMWYRLQCKFLYYSSSNMNSKIIPLIWLITVLRTRSTSGISYFIWTLVYHTVFSSGGITLFRIEERKWSILIYFGQWNLHHSQDCGTHSDNRFVAESANLVRVPRCDRKNCRVENLNTVVAYQLIWSRFGRAEWNLSKSQVSYQQFLPSCFLLTGNFPFTHRWFYI